MKSINVHSLGSFNREALAAGLPGFTLGEEQRPAHALMVRSPKILSADYPELRAIARAGAGIDNIDANSLAPATDRGIPVFNTPGANALSVAEMAFFALGSYVRQLHVGVLGFARGGVSVGRAEELKKQIGATRELTGKRLGIVGYGAIGRNLARIAQAFGMKVVVYDPYAKTDGVSIPVPFSIAGLFAGSDYASVHVDLSPKTRGLIGVAELAACKPRMVLLNTSRSGVCDEAAVRRALELNLGGYVTDVDEWPWLGESSRAVVIPHLGGSTVEGQDRCVSDACESLREFFRRGAILRSVNFPATEPGPIPEACVRIAFANRNHPGMLAKVLDAIADHGFNVSGNVHHSRDAIGYGVVDVDKVGPETDHERWGDLIAEEIGKIPGILMARRVG